MPDNPDLTRSHARPTGIPPEDYTEFIKWLSSSRWWTNLIPGLQRGQMSPDQMRVFYDRWVELKKPPAWGRTTAVTPGGAEQVQEAAGDEVDPRVQAQLDEQARFEAEEQRRWELEFGLSQGEFQLRQQQQAWQQQRAGQASPEGFEEFRRRLLGELNQPEDWITRWMVANPRSEQHGARQQELMAEQIIGFEERLESLPPGDRGEQFETPEGLEFAPSELEERILASLLDKQATLAEFQAASLGAPAEPPRTPLAPAWLPQFAPSQVAGQPITRGAVRTPSLQQWARTPWSVRQGLSGFAEFAGGRPLQDILEHAQMMAPSTPAGGSRWRAARQR